MPGINWILMLSCVALVLAFGSSTNLAAAYGVAVTTTMVITTVLLFMVQYERWGWSLATALAVSGFFLVIDLGFWIANLVKIPDGGWLPLVIGAFVFTLMTTWKHGREILIRRTRAGTVGFTEFVADLPTHRYARVPGTAVFMYSDPEATPPALLQNLEHNKVLHERVILLSVKIEEAPHVLRKERAEFHDLKDGFYRVILHYGFMDRPSVHADFTRILEKELGLKRQTISYFLGRERLFPSRLPGMALWREGLFAWMTRNARPAHDFFGLPNGRVVELGAQVEI